MTHLHVVTEGEGPLVILMHGWPELGLSWRRQVPALVAAGYRVAVPDMPGYGRSEKPETVEPYRLDAVADDMATIAASLGASRWVAVGHDWGAPAAWRCALRFPEQVAAVFGLSVPYARPGKVRLAEAIEALYPDRFFYMRYFQSPGVAEAEFAAADMAAALKAIYFFGSGDRPSGVARAAPPRDAKFLDSTGTPPAGPLSFMSDEELAAYARAFEAGGMRGPLNWYRNFDRNAEDARAYGDGILHQPAGFIAGARDQVLAMFPGQLEHMRRALADLRVENIIEGAGHWIQQERPDAVNATLIAFLDAVRERL